MAWFFLIFVFLLAAACGYSFSRWRAAGAIALLLFLALGLAIAVMGEGAILVAAYGGGPILIICAFGHALGAKLRRGDDAA
jgi:hypothetical protein